MIRPVGGEQQGERPAQWRLETLQLNDDDDGGEMYITVSVSVLVSVKKS